METTMVKTEIQELRECLDRANTLYAAQADENDRTIKRLLQNNESVCGYLSDIIAICENQLACKNVEYVEECFRHIETNARYSKDTLMA